MSAPKGYSSQEKEDRLSAQFQTIEPIRELQFGSSVVAHQFVYLVTTDSVEAGSTASIIVATGHQALKGDVIVFYNDNKEAKVWDTTPNTIILAETLSAAPAAADTFGIQRHKYPSVDSSGQLITSAAEVATAPNTDPLPALVKVVAGWESSLNEVHALAVDGSGILQTNVTASALPTGAATEATLATLATEATVATLATESTLATLATEVTSLDTNGKVGTIETTLTALSAAVATEATLATLATEATVSTLATEATVLTLGTETTLLAVKTAVEAIENTVSGSELQVDVVTSALPAGAATEATLLTLGTETTLSAIKTSVEIIDNAISGNEMQVDVVSSALPTGAATETTLASVEADTTALAGCVSGNEIQVDIVAALPSGTNTIGKIDVNTLSVVDLLDAGILDTSSTNIAGSASSPTQVVASTAAATKKLQLLDTTGAFIGVYTGAVTSEVLQFVMGPGSDQTIEHSIPAGTRISLKRLDSTTAISSGIVAINLIG